MVQTCPGAAESLGCDTAAEPSVARICRARALLGTVVAITIEGLPAAEAHERIEAGFRAIEAIHRLMSFHALDSDVSRLNREASRHAVRVDPRTFAVLARAVSLAAASGGAFDVTVAAKLVEAGYLPAPQRAEAVDPAASWRDIELMPQGRVRFHRPLWIDLGGIAKGFAVDRAVECIGQPPGVQLCVNAGGDLRVRGPRRQLVYLGLPSGEGELPAVMLQNASLASSSGLGQARAPNGAPGGPHRHGIFRRVMGNRSFVSVIADECVLADALTKIVMAQGLGSDALLRRLGAAALLYRQARGWSRLGARA